LSVKIITINPPPLGFAPHINLITHTKCRIKIFQYNAFKNIQFEGLKKPRYSGHPEQGVCHMTPVSQKKFMVVGKMDITKA